MSGFRFIALLLPVILCGLAGCTTLMQGAPLPEGFALKKVTKADRGTPFAVNRSGAFAAISKGGIEITDPDGSGRKIAREAASALCFSPAGDRLAAALPTENGTMLRLFDLEGNVIGETAIPERVTSIAWRSEQQVLAASLSIKKFTFGSELTSRLYQWDGLTPPAAVTLSDVTVRPPVGKLPPEQLFNSLSIAVSPYGDEIAYSQLKDPPLFTPYLRIAIRHLETGAEREVGKTSVGSGGILYTPDGESLLVGDAQSLTRKLSLPEGKELYAWPSPGSHSALSPSGSYTFLDGLLYQDGRTIATFPPQTRGAFLPDGSGLVLSYDGKVFLVSGLKDRAAALPTEDLDRLLKLRRLRSMGLITEKEYRAQKQKEPAR